MNKKLIAVILAAMTVIPTLAACGKKDNDVIGGADGLTSVEVTDESGEPQEPQGDVTPTFMYFVSAQDEAYDAEMQTVNELKEQYGDKVNFEITNIDENPEAAENFPVAGQTPALIMLDTTNNISALEFMMSDKATLEKDIKAALGE